MGCATSKLVARGSRTEAGADPDDVDRNKQNNHIIRDGADERPEQRFAAVDGQRRTKKDDGSASGSAATGHANSNGDGKSARRSAPDLRRADDARPEPVLFGPLVTGSAADGGRIAFRIVTLKVGIDKKPTALDEKSAAVLKYRTPHFRASAVVEVPSLAEDKAITIGWIQTCSRMKFINTYGQEGVTSWEFPDIVTGRYAMISDADGKQYPWYGSRHEVHTVEGPSARQTIHVHMNDNFFPQVTWYVPHPSYDRTARLTHIHREQTFFTFLVAKDLASGAYDVLRAITWSMTINIDVAPDGPLGRRATLLEPIHQRAPVILGPDRPGAGVRPEPSAMEPPNANGSQVLVWRPVGGEPRVVVPPEESAVDLDDYLRTTRHYVRQVAHHVRES